jgi:aspartyl-tRNA(Asn)/glutamyl-tRNA(Gln) amidotransferase subunit C
MGIGRKEVEYVAALARLELTPEETDALTGQLDRILDYVAKLGELNTDGVEPTSQVLPAETALRDDTVRDPLPRDEALAGAPDRKGDFFRVPRIIE